MKLNIFMLLVFTTTTVFGQKQANLWHFGNGRVINFSSGVPVLEAPSPLSAYEGTASFCDVNGNLLFYTDGGGKIWNAANQVMYDMQGIQGGGLSAMQSSVFIEAPCEPNKYYLFTMDELETFPGGNGLSYFKIDMTLNSGLGAVTQPGTIVHAPSFEGLAAIKHRNSRDYWIIIHQDTVGLGVYKVTSAGVSLHSVYNIGNGGTKYIIKASPDGSKIYTKPTNNNIYDIFSPVGLLFDFDNSTGIISNPININITEPYANLRFEFSPNSRWLYTSVENGFIRLDLSAPNINASANSIFGNLNFIGGGCDMQLAPDGNIYQLLVTYDQFTGISTVHVNRIKCPNNNNPLFEPDIFSFPANTSNYVECIGLPNFPSRLFEDDEATFVALGKDTVFLCDSNGTIQLDALNPGANFLWSNGSTTQTLTVNSPGTYAVTVSANCGIGTDTIVVLDCIGEIISGNSNCISADFPFSINSSINFSNVMWNFGDPSSGSANNASGINTTHTFSAAGTYEVTAQLTYNCVDYIISKIITLGGFISSVATQTACSSYVAPWGTTYTQSGLYTDTLFTASGCDSIIQIDLNITGFPALIVGSVSGTCGQPNGTATATATGGAGNYAYSWSNGATGNFISGLTSGSYSVVATDQNGCSATSQVIVSTAPAAGVTLTASDTILGLNETAVLEILGGDTYNWIPSTGLSCDDCFSVIASPSSSTTYTVTGTDTSGCPYLRVINVLVDIVCNELFVPNIFSPNGIGNAENEKLYVYSNCVKSMNLGIYNRWGELIYATDDQAACWDGTHKGVPVMTGVYAYRLFVEQFDGQKIEKTGNILLTR
jgi:gliding motility-associated-like protein